MTLMTHDPKADFEVTAASFKDGYWYEFSDGEDEIAVHGSAWTGKETVYFNDEIVSDKRNLTSLKEEHIFEKSGHSYRVQMITTSLLKAEVLVQIWKDDVFIGSKAQSLAQTIDIKKNLWKFLLALVAFFAAGFLVGTLVAKVASGDLSIW